MKELQVCEAYDLCQACAPTVDAPNARLLRSGARQRIHACHILHQAHGPACAQEEQAALDAVMAAAPAHSPERDKQLEVGRLYSRGCHALLQTCCKCQLKRNIAERTTKWQKTSNARTTLAHSALILGRRGSNPRQYVLCRRAWYMLLSWSLLFRTQPHLGCCLAAATAAASTVSMHL
jgi:hypothetical protein